MIILIACIDAATYGIGKDNKLLFNLKKDMSFFKSTTMNKTIVMGRETYDNLPTKPLPKRRNIVLSRNKDLTYEGADVCNDIDEIVKLGKTEDVFICGGEKIYKQFLPYADEAFLTIVHSSDKVEPDTFFPLDEFMNDSNWIYSTIKRFNENGCFGTINKMTKKPV